MALAKSLVGGARSPPPRALEAAHPEALGGLHRGAWAQAGITRRPHPGEEGNWSIETSPVRVVDENHLQGCRRQSLRPGVG